MKVNFLILILFVLVVAGFIVLFLIRNKKDKEDLTYRINNDFPVQPGEKDHMDMDQPDPD